MSYFAFLFIGANSSCDTDLSLCFFRRALKIIFLCSPLWIGVKAMGALGRWTILFGTKFFFSKKALIYSFLV